jgi:hypothetical protein
MDFPGTLSASPRVYLDLLNDLAENLLAHGFLGVEHPVVVLRRLLHIPAAHVHVVVPVGRGHR